MYRQFSFATEEIKLHYIMELALADEEALLIFLIFLLHFPLPLPLLVGAAQSFKGIEDSISLVSINRTAGRAIV